MMLCRCATTVMDISLSLSLAVYTSDTYSVGLLGVTVVPLTVHFTNAVPLAKQSASFMVSGTFSTLVSVAPFSRVRRPSPCTSMAWAMPSMTVLSPTVTSPPVIRRPFPPVLILTCKSTPFCSVTSPPLTVRGVAEFFHV